MYSVPDGWLSQRGLPHSEISGSQPVSGSPELFAAVHVLLRLSLPRHPPCALRSLTVYPKGTCLPEWASRLLRGLGPSLVAARGPRVLQYAPVRARARLGRNPLAYADTPILEPLIEISQSKAPLCRGVVRVSGRTRNTALPVICSRARRSCHERLADCNDMSLRTAVRNGRNVYKHLRSVSQVAVVTRFSEIGSRRRSRELEALSSRASPPARRRAGDLVGQGRLELPTLRRSGA